MEFLIAGPGNVDFLLSLAETLLSLEPPTRGKYILLSVLTRHVSITSLLRTAPRLPEEIMGVMGHQTLACHVSRGFSQVRCGQQPNCWVLS